MSSKSSASSVGNTLRAARLEKKLTLKEVELATRIRGKYLRAIEADDHTTLPHDIYSRGFVHSYAEYLNLNAEKLADRFMAAAGTAPVQIARRPTRVNLSKGLSLRSLTLSVVGLVLLAVAGYLFWQFSALTSAPKLTVSNPDHDQVLYGSLITINGIVSGGADMFVNDSPILSDANGNFTDSIALQEGVNAIRITAKNRLGKSTTVTRNILAHVPKTDPADALPTAPFDGVAASVQIKDATAAVTIHADGKEVFKGTMLPGTVQNFKAATLLTVSTSNAGATIITVTNLTTASKYLGPVGALGQPKTDLEFAKDTQFQ